ncbi:MAG: hypothetical protein RRA92_10475, partial [Gemmatimonadota bacterium]|nr:hypothetical protein [Gemmatimonadota bacterium]
MHYAKLTVAALAAVLLLTPAAGRAQDRPIASVQAHGSLVIPLDTFEDITEVGGGFGGAALWHFHPNWALRGDVDVMKLNERDTETGFVAGPPVDLLYVGGGVEVSFGPPRYQDVPLTFALHLGGGTLNFDVDETFFAPHLASSIDEWYPALNGGGQVGYQLTEYLNLFFQTQAYLIFFDE